MTTLFVISLADPFYFMLSTSFKNVISLCNLFIMASSKALTSCLLTRYITFLARSANFKVLIVSSML